MLLLHYTTSAQNKHLPILVEDRCKNCSNVPNAETSTSLMTVYNNQLVVSLYDTVVGRQLWTYNGVDTLTMVPNTKKRLNLDTHYPVNYAEVNGELYFHAYPTDTNSFKRELSKWDGINPITLVKDLGPGAYPSYIDVAIAFNNNLYFYCGSCPTVNGNFFLKEYSPATDSVRGFNIHNPNNQVQLPFSGIFTYKNRVYIKGGLFREYDLHSVDPTIEDTLRKLNPDSSGIYEIRGPIIYKDTMYYLAYTDSGGVQLYAYDGVGTPTKLTSLPSKSLSTASNHYTDDNVIVFKDKLYFTCDTTGNNFDHSFYSYDFATKAITKIPQMIDAKTFRSFRIIYKDNLIYQTDSVTYISDGIKSDTLHPYGFRPTRFAIYNNDLYMAGRMEPYGYELYKFNDTLLNNAVQSMRFNASEVVLFPNPTSNNVNISINLLQPTVISVSLTDISGRILISTQSNLYSTGKTTLNIPTANLPQGNYFVILKGNNGRMLWSGKMLKD